MLRDLVMRECLETSKHLLRATKEQASSLPEDVVEMFGFATAGGGSIDLPGCLQGGKRGTNPPISNKRLLSSHSISITDLPFTFRRISNHS